MLDSMAFRWLQDLKKDWRFMIEGDGGYCPCCDRWGKISAFTITETHALALLWLSRQETVDGWVDVPPIAPQWMLRGKNYQTMAKWDLIRKGSRTNLATKSDGMWQVTQRGWDFIRGDISVPAKAYIYNNSVEGWSDEEVYFRNCFGKKFDYDRVMSDCFYWADIK